MIHLLFTGGTISMQRDPAAGGNVPAHGGETLVGFVPELKTIAPHRIEDWGRVPACHMDLGRLWQLRTRVAEVAANGEVDGVVVTHGTDLIEETAYLIARTVPPAVPVAITGAMLTSSDADWDGPRNLTDAARVVSASDSGGRGAMVVFAGGIFDGFEVVKLQATALNAFGTPHGAPLGRVERGVVRFGSPARVARPTLLPPGLTARVALVAMMVGDQGVLLDAARQDHEGLVIAAFGSGNLPPGAVPAIRRWLGEGKPVVLASRCPFGQVSPIYAFEGGGAMLVREGVIPAGPRTPSQARMELTIALSAGVVYGAGLEGTARGGTA
jgi:L-asparaginase